MYMVVSVHNIPASIMFASVIAEATSSSVRRILNWATGRCRLSKHSSCFTWLCRPCLNSVRRGLQAHILGKVRGAGRTHICRRLGVPQPNRDQNERHEQSKSKQPGELMPNTCQDNVHQG